MDIEKLKKKRQLNVQEQNAVEKDSIYRSASYWRTNGLPLALTIALSERGVVVEKCILLDYEQDFPGVSTDEGIVITENGQFFAFEMDLSTDRTELVECYVWKEITNEFEISQHKPGIGSTRGYLALEVLSDLNQY